MSESSRYTGLVDKYRDRLPIAGDTPAVTLCEGDTPLMRLANVERELDRGVEVYAKFEGANPTGSFKSRGMSAAVSMALHLGAEALITMGCGENCPHVPGLRIEDWALPDPKGQDVEAVRGIRDDIRGRIRKFVARELA